tara:strand:- start:81 stop:716 length:636 start_codon:yes stop_codon:yes gene_type:complete
MGLTMIKRRCFRDPIPELFTAANKLDAAVSAHVLGRSEEAQDYFHLANNLEVRAWLESIWGKGSSYVTVNKLPLPPAWVRVPSRMPTLLQKRALHARDGYHCRFCGIPVIRPEIRKLAVKLYPATVTWGRTNASQHAGFQALWAQYDHVVPYSCGGTNELENLVVTCAGCNFGKMSYRLEELGLLDPRDFLPVASPWDGLERFLPRGQSGS